MAWFYLIGAGILEIGWAIGLKYTDGWTRTVPSILTAGAMIVSFYLLSQALRVLPIGTAYAIWTGIGAVGASLVGMWLLGESAKIERLVCIGLIVVGIVGLKMVSDS